MKRLKEWLIWLGALFKRLFSRRQPEQSSVVPPSYNSTGDLTVPKQLGAGNPPASEQLLREMSEDISHREAALDAKLVDAKIEQMSAEQKLRERELDAKAANEKARLEFEQKQFELEAEERRAKQARMDREHEQKLALVQFKTEQEEFRKNNEQAETSRQKRREEKQQDQAKRAERRAQRWQAFKTSASHILSKLGSGIQFSFRKAWEQLNKKWVKPILGALLIVGFGFWFFQTETGQLWLFGFLGWLEQNQQYVITALGVALLLVLAYRLVRSDRWAAVKASLSALVKRKSFWVSVLTVALIGGIVWLYQQNFFEGWLTAILSFAWTNRVYLIVALVAVSLALFVRWFRKSPARMDWFNDVKAQARDFGTNLRSGISVMARSLILIGLSFVAIYGSYFGSSTLIIGSIGTIPVFAFGLKPGPTLWFRLFLAGSMGILAVLLLLPSRY